MPSASPARPAADPLLASRIAPLDTFRALTVTFALVSHALLEFGVASVVPEETWLAMRTLTRAATPSLLVLFGVLAEVVHARRYAEIGAALRPRLFHRALQCYLAFAVLSVLVALTRPEPPLYVAKSLLFSTLEGYTAIFALYALLLVALAVAVLPLRRRWGMGGVAAVVAVVWCVDALVLRHLPTAAPPLHVLADITLGLGRRWGPSAWHALSLVAAGMALGHLLYVRPRRRSAGLLVALLGAAALGIVGGEVVEARWGGFAARLVDLGQYRAHNHPAYAAYGFLASTVLLALSYVLHAALPRRVGGAVGRLGAATFSYFAIGNAVLILIPDHTVGSRAEAIALVVGVVGASAVLTRAWAYASRRSGLGAALRARTERLFGPPREAAA